jgi:hypothetical protein
MPAWPGCEPLRAMARLATIVSVTPGLARCEKQRAVARVLAAVAVTSWLTGCASGAPDAAVVRTDSAGVDIVLSRGADRALDWQLEEVLRIGGRDEGPQAFFRVRAGGVATDAAGNIYVLDVGDTELRVFGADGTYLRSHGQKGSGPGELRDAASLLVTPDGEAWVWDAGKQAFVRFEAGGAVLDEVRLPPAIRPEPGASSLTPGGGLITQADDCGRSCVLAVGDPIRTSLLHLPAGVTWQEATAAELGVIAWEQPDFRPVGAARCGFKLKTPPIFSRTPVWHAAADGVVYNGTEAYAVTLAMLDGRRTSIRRDLPPVRATRELAEQEIGPLESAALPPGMRGQRRGAREPGALGRARPVGPRRSAHAGR